MLPAPLGLAVGELADSSFHVGAGLHLNEGRFAGRGVELEIRPAMVGEWRFAASDSITLEGRQGSALERPFEEIVRERGAQTRGAQTQ